MKNHEILEPRPTVLSSKAPAFLPPSQLKALSSLSATASEWKPRASAPEWRPANSQEFERRYDFSHDEILVETNLDSTVDSDPSLEILTLSCSVENEDTPNISSDFHQSHLISAKDFADVDEETFSFGNFSPDELDVNPNIPSSLNVAHEINAIGSIIKSESNESHHSVGPNEILSEKGIDVSLLDGKKSSLPLNRVLESTAENSAPPAEPGSDVDASLKTLQHVGKKKSVNVNSSMSKQVQAPPDRKVLEDKRNSNQYTSCRTGAPKNTGHDVSSSSSTPGGTPRVPRVHGHTYSGSRINANVNNWVRRKTLFHEKGSILACFTRGYVAPPEMKELYGVFCRERGPTNKLPEVDDKIKFTPRVVVVDDTSSPAYIYKQALVTFNKLSLQNFDRILDKFLTLGVEKEESLYAKIIELIVSKAQLEPTFCDMYVRFCKCVQDRISKINKELGDNFREKLLERCREEFEMDRDAAFARIEGESLSSEEIEEKKYVLKLRYIGHMKFIGELYQYDVVNAKIMHTCIEDLLSSTEEEKLVCVCKLLQVVGKKLEDHDTRKKKPSKFRNYLESMQTKSEDVASYSSRVRFMFKDVIELHKNRWVSRSDVEAMNKLLNGKLHERSMNTLQHGSKLRDELGIQNQDGWSTVSSSKGKKMSAFSSGANYTGNYLSNSLVTKPKSPLVNKLSNSSIAYVGKDHRKDAAGTRGLGFSSSPSESMIGPTSDLERIDGEFSHAGSKGQQNCSQDVLPNPMGVEILRGSDGIVDKDTLRRVQAAAEEFLLNGLLNEAMEVLKELVHPNGMKDVVRCLLNVVVEKKKEDVEKFYPFIPAMYSCGILDKAGFHEGLVDFLDGYDDLTVDVPLAGKSTALLLSHILMNSPNVFDITIFTNIPQENLFTDSPQYIDLIAQILEQVVEKISTSEAERIYEILNLNKTFRSRLQAIEDVEHVALKYNLSFLRV